MDYESLGIEKRANRDATLLATVRYNEQIREFVGDSRARFEYVRPELSRIAEECAGELGADRTVVLERLTALVEPGRAPLVRWSETQSLTQGQGEAAPSGGWVDDDPNQPWLEEGEITDVNDHEPVLDDKDWGKQVDVTSCFRCNSAMNIVEANISPVCKTCTDELVKSAAPHQQWTPGSDDAERLRGTEYGTDWDDTDEPLQNTCPMCGGPGEPLGQLGRLMHFRCRNCGMVFNDGGHTGKNAAGSPLPLGNNEFKCPEQNCPFTGDYAAVSQHMNTPHSGQQPQPGTMAAVKWSVPGDAPAPTPGAQVPPASPSPPPVDADQGLTDEQNPGHKFDDIVADLANRASAKQFSIISDDEAQQIASRYGIDPEEVKKSVISVATFGNYSATNGQVQQGTANVPDDYTEIDMVGMGGQVDAHEAIVPTDLAATAVASDLGIQKEDVYNSIRDTYGGELDDQYHTTVSGTQKFYLPTNLVGKSDADTADENMGEATKGIPQAPQQQVPPS